MLLINPEPRNSVDEVLQHPCVNVWFDEVEINAGIGALQQRAFWTFIDFAHAVKEEQFERCRSPGGTSSVREIGSERRCGAFFDESLKVSASEQQLVVFTTTTTVVSTRKYKLCLEAEHAADLGRQSG
ncbi:unnamed protein product [Soboliphyme baturini]|uniref:Uncharacterized protein n=1 Tax=Soboliphyme baturini TaxID=241478 RepID=A0A183J5H6_9BILA|nr:unnamed protein product [Soboliphyme baturini]